MESNKNPDLPCIGTVIAALADDTRRALVSRLAAGSCTVGELARAFPMTRPAISQHLKILRDAGLVCATAVGRHQHYSAQPEALDQLAQWLDGLRVAPKSVAAAADTPDDVDSAAAGWAEAWPLEDPVTFKLVTRLMRIAREMENLMERTAAQARINGADVILLGTLSRMQQDYRTTPTVLARAALLSLPGIAKRLERLESMQLVERHANPEDARSHLIQITPTGRALIDTIVHKQMSGNYAAIHQLNEVDKADLGRILRSIHQRMPR